MKKRYAMKKLPIGMQTFEKLIQGNFLYVDKTEQIFHLISQGGGYFFLSRPRRFGKSLLISTLKDIFSGHQELFKGLFIYDKIEWTAYPVIHLDFLVIPRDTEERLKQGIRDVLEDIAAQHKVELKRPDYDSAFRELIAKLAEKYQQPVVVLIDEYDKPIVEHIENLEAAQKNRTILRNFYEILKGSDQHLNFVFLTGVSKFSKVSIFSSLNNLQDITFSPRFATIAGYTQDELETCFEPYIDQLREEQQRSRADVLAQIKSWYNGYSWNAKDRVYNPFSILNLFADNIFDNYWFATGTPTLLIELAKQKKIDITEFERARVSKILFERYDIENIDLLTLLMQTGYLTITAVEHKQERLYYVLGYPNQEVKHAFVTYLFEAFTTNRMQETHLAAEDLREALLEENLERFMNIIRSLFAKIPYTLHIEAEAYYHSLFYMILALMGVEIDLEVLTDKGRIDGILECDERVWLIEFKYGSAGTTMETLTRKAIRQIRKKHYAERFLNDSRKCLLLGVGFVEKEIGYTLKTGLTD